MQTVTNILAIIGAWSIAIVLFILAWAYVMRRNGPSRTCTRCADSFYPEADEKYCPECAAHTHNHYLRLSGPELRGGPRIARTRIDLN